MANYVTTLTALVGDSVELVDLASVGVEHAAGGSRLARGRGELRVRRSMHRADTPVLVTWPSFGLLDPLTWSTGAGGWLVVHDPLPLRRQFASGALAAWAGRHQSGPRRLSVLAHSESARQVLLERGWPEVRVLPLPTSPVRPPAAGDGTILVLGQFKPSRSLECMHALGVDPAWAGRLTVVGRGWPAVAGWDVIAEFVSEDEIDRRLASASVVVLPYDFYFQSGIAVRALAAGTPVVGERHEHLASLYGPDWDGFVQGGDWSAAVTRAEAVPLARLLALGETAYSHARREWISLFAPPGS